MGLPYCIKDNNGKFLKWDGNGGGSSYFYGLTVDSDDKCLSNVFYQFQFVKSGSNLRLQNIGAGYYLNLYNGNYILLYSAS
jgi:hypothetical protein